MLNNEGISSPDLRAIGLFAALSDAELDRIAPTLTPKRVSRGTTLVMEKDLSQQICFVWSGRFRLVVASPPKANVFMRTLTRGATFGSLPAVLGRSFGNRLRIVCDADGVILRMSDREFHALRRDMPKLEDEFVRLLATLTADQASRIYELSALSARERLQAELLRMARDGEWDGDVRVVRPAPTHQMLAEQIGAAREVVTRILKAFSEEGLIRVAGGEIRFLDVGKLLDLDEAATGRRMYDPPSR